MRRADYIPGMATGSVYDEWTDEETNMLCDLVADGVSISAAARRIGRSKNAAVGKFGRIRQSFGWQAQ